MRSIFLSYLLCAAGFFGFAGLHRFYLGQYFLGFAYFFTGGFFGIGTVLDLIRMPTLVDKTNEKILLGKASQRLLRNPFLFLSNPERTILQLADSHGNVVTPQMVVMNSHLTLHEAKGELERLRKNNFCTLDIAEDGGELYRFHGLRPQKPIY